MRFRMTLQEWHESWNRARELARAGHIDAAISHLRAILPSTVDVANIVFTVRCLEMITWLCIRTGRYHEAKSSFQQVEELLSRHNIVLTALDNYNHELNRAILQMQYHSMDQASQSLQLCYKIARALKRPTLKLRTLRYLGIVDLLRGETVDAISRVHEILKITRTSRKKHLEELVAAHLVLAYLSQSKGDQKSFQDHLQEIITLLPKIQNENALLSLTKTFLYTFISNEKNSEIIMRALEVILPKINDDSQLTSDFCLLIAYYCLKNGDVEQYRNWLALGFRYEDRFLTPYQLALHSFLQAQVILIDGFSSVNRRERIQTAKKYLEKSQKIALSLDFSFHRVLSGLSLASLYLEENDLNSAISIVQEVMDLARLRQWWPLALKSESLLIDLLILDGNYGEARKRIDKLRQILPFKPELMKFVNIAQLECNLTMAVKLESVGKSLESLKQSRELKISDIQSYIQECLALIVE